LRLYGTRKDAHYVISKYNKILKNTENILLYNIWMKYLD